MPAAVTNGLVGQPVGGRLEVEHDRRAALAGDRGGDGRAEPGRSPGDDHGSKFTLHGPPR
jgi:hypothetical protein